MIKRITFAVLIAATMIFGASQLAQAQASGVTNTQAYMLLEQCKRLAQVHTSLAPLCARLEELLGAPTTPSISCPTINRTLVEGMRGEDVRQLQQFLVDQGLLERTSITGFFGPATEAAVQRFQCQEGLACSGGIDSGHGVVGPRTRDAIARKCGGTTTPSGLFRATPVSGTAPLTVTFSSMVGGFRPSNISYMIDFGDGTSERAQECSAPADACVSPGTNRHTYTRNGTYTATLKKITTNTCTGTSEVACAAWESREDIVGRVQITVGGVTACTLEYAPVCGSKQVTCVTTPCNPVQQTYSNRCMMQADGATFVHAGECRTTGHPKDDPQCKRWREGGFCSGMCSRETPGGTPICAVPACAPVDQTSPPNPPAQCLEYFGTTDNRPPTISGFSGPTVLSVNETGTWTVRASDPENGELSYQIRWGDEGTLESLLSLAQSDANTFVQRTTFTHAYSRAGTYTVAVTVRDSAGKTAQSSATVRVGGGTTACTMEYAPVCGQPPFVCNAPPGAACAQVMPAQQTYSNRCLMNAAGASFVHEGACSSPYVDSIGCVSGGMTYPEGHTTGTIVHANGTVTTISDAQYVCRGGEWVTAGFGVVGETNVCTFESTPVGTICNGKYHCTQRGGAHFWSTLNCTYY